MVKFQEKTGTWGRTGGKHNIIIEGCFFFGFFFYFGGKKRFKAVSENKMNEIQVPG